MMTPSDARIGLSLAIEPGNTQMTEPLERWGPVEFWERLRSDHRGAEFPQLWSQRAHDVDVRAIKKSAAERGLRWLAPGDESWPAGLSDLAHVELAGFGAAPLGLWIRGGADFELLGAEAVSIVGARACTTYGAEVATDLGAQCSSAGLVVISGAAFGIDACAHRGALAVGGPTIAVLACGADIDYPRSHGALLERIGRHGLIVSEYPPGSPVNRHRFLARNRVIAALSRGTVVVEAARRSGALNTVHWSDLLGRTTMGWPGPSTSAHSAGVHETIRLGKAHLVAAAEHVIDDICGTGSLHGDDTDTLRLIWDVLDPWIPRSSAELSGSHNAGDVDVDQLLATLCRNGLARAHDGNWYRRGHLH